LWELPGLDIAQYHLYLGEKSDPAGRRIQETVRRFRERYEKPMLFGEYGVSFRGPGREEDPFARGLRQGIWSSLLSGSAGTVLPWWWDDIHPRDGWKTWTTLARFLEGTGVGGPDWAPVEGVKARGVGEDGSIGESMDVFALGDGKSLLAYLIHPQYHYPRNAQLLGLGPGHASVLLSFPRAMVARTVRAESWRPWMTNLELPPEVELNLDPAEPETLLRTDWLDKLKERMPGEGVAHLPCFTDDAAVRILSVPDLLQCRDDKGSERPVSSREEWEGRRTRIMEGMQRVMGPLPGPEHVVPPDVRVLEETDFPAYTQRRITFAVEDWDRLPACLLIPKNIEGKAPAVLCLHPTSPLGKDVVTGRGEGTNRNYAQELAERGFVTLAPDYPGFGDYVPARRELYDRGYKSATMKGIWNHMRCVDLLQSLPEVDPDRIGCVGHSLGGHNTLFLAAFDPRIRAAVTSCGFTSFAKYYGGDLTGWTHDGYMPAIASEFGKDPARMPFDFPGVLAAIAPRPLFINAPVLDANFDVSGVRDCVAAALPVYGLLGADGALCAEYPHDEHDFPEHVRKQAYGFLWKHLCP
ncbi:MAG TPA: alpha/beta fold hydrolase, partial [Candidatus Hydrogenedentes bacterium]|nr:alpha/beta fold hydrolase [Candidatus Hydrogenedentota bacterium]